MLAAIALVLLVLWALGFLAFHVGPIIHLLIIAAIVVFVYNLITGRKTGI